WSAVQNNVHNNTVTFRGNTFTLNTYTAGLNGLFEDYGDVRSQNTFDYNTYHAPSVNDYHWGWGSSYPSFSNYVSSSGQDTHSTADTNVPAALNLSCAYLGSIGAGGSGGATDTQ